ncbi:MAG TPA: hypothetical protein VN256_03490 [Pyrinomonadaceae bacterium]|nr:hypothetical protein [Pyrinomonadaceae bacterium]
MKVTPIRRPLAGERVVAVQPEMKPMIEAGWRRRLRFYTGRSLSDKALTTEQVGRAGRLATRGQMVSSGVVSGLSVGLERPDSPALITVAVTEGSSETSANVADLDNYYLHISPGTGIAASGEDVFVPRNMRVPIGAVPVYTTTDILSEFDGPAGPVSPRDESPREELIKEQALARSRALSPRRLGPPIQRLLERGILKLPPVAILVLRPIVLKRVGDFDAEDQCEQDPQNYAYEDWQLVDGCQLILYAWPAELVSLSPLQVFGRELLRNRLAHTIFEEEMRALGEGRLLPWEELGVPIGLLAFGPDFVPSFVDRHSVVRAGGKPRRRSVLVPDILKVMDAGAGIDPEFVAPLAPLLPNAGNPFVWQARLEQFAEQMEDARLEAIAVREAAGQFALLPPAGLLPRTAVDLSIKGCTNHFFPVQFEMTAVPVPVEQLDVAIEQSAALKPLDTSLSEDVRLLVPVPQVYYEPRLLTEEEVDPEFEENIEAAGKRLGTWLTRRQDVHAKARVINRGINGANATFPEPESREGEAPSGSQIDATDPELKDPEKNYGTAILEGLLLPVAYTTLLDEFKAFPFMSKELPIGVDKIDAVGLKAYIALLEDKVRRANDIVDFGFVRIQTDLYRHRQLMLGSIEASRLATSPALAAIAKGETALATKEEIVNYLHSASAQTPGQETKPGPVGTGAASGADIISKTMVGFVGAGQGNFFTQASDEQLAQAEATADESVVSTQLDVGVAGSTLVTDQLLIGQGQSTLISNIATESLVNLPSAAALFGSQATAFTTDAVYLQSPIVGYALDFRNVTVAERIKEAPAPEAKKFSVSSKYEVVRALEELADIIVIDDLKFPGFLDYGDDDKQDLKTDTITFQAKNNETVSVMVPRQKLRTVGEIKSLKLAGQVLAGRHDNDPSDGDEAAFFAAGVRASDKAVAILRIIEGRIQAYQNVIRICQRVLGELNSLAAQINARLKVIEDNIAEARHDLAVARLLLAEEQARVSAINDRRQKVLDEHVPFLAYQRERTTDLLRETKSRELDPAMTESPVPACLSRRATPPPALRSMIQVLRHAPVKWFVNVHPLLDKFDRMEYLQATVVSAKARAGLQLPAVQEIAQANSPFGNLGQAIGQVVGVQKQVVTKYRQETAQLDLGALASHSWTLFRDRAREVVSLGDLIDPGHGRSDVSQRAAGELDNITHVAACLYSSLGVVLPVIRLDWAERISQFDAPLNLRNLASLPRWGEIKYLDRREMQTFVDWLFSRVDPRQPEAVLMINDLVRVCILLASHAPINEIIAARLAQPTEAREGGRVHLTVDPAKVRVGMQVLMYNANQVVARGVVEDLSSGQVAAKVTQVNGLAKTVSLTESSQFQIAEADAFDRSPTVIGAGFVKA